MKSKVNYIDPETMKLLLDKVASLPTHADPKDIQMLFKTCYHCALRINEALKLKPENFDLEEREVFLGDTKASKAERRVIPKEFIKELASYLSSKEGRIWNYNRITVWNWLKTLGKELDIPSLTTSQSETHEKTVTHIFRKSNAKDMLYKKIPLNIVSKKLGHHNINTTSSYLKVNLEDVKQYE